MSEERDGLMAEEEYEQDLLTLEDEDGNEVTFEVIDAVDIDGDRYLALVPQPEENASEDEDEDAAMLIMRVGEENGEEYLDLVEDENELASVGEVFYNRLSEMYEIELDELQGE